MLCQSLQFCAFVPPLFAQFGALQLAVFFASRPPFGAHVPAGHIPPLWATAKSAEAMANKAAANNETSFMYDLPKSIRRPIAQECQTLLYTI